MVDTNIEGDEIYEDFLDLEYDEDNGDDVGNADPNG